VKQTIPFIYGTPSWHSPARFFDHLSASLAGLGYDIARLDSGAEDFDRSLLDVMAKRDPAFFFSFNFKGADVRIDGRPFYDAAGARYITTLDTPYNKVEQIQRAGTRIGYWAADPSFTPFIQRLAPDSVRYLNFRSMAIVDEADVADSVIPPLAQRPIDVLFIGSIRRTSGVLESADPGFRRFEKRFHEQAFSNCQTPVYLLAETIARGEADFEALFQGEFRSPGFGMMIWALTNAVRTRRRIRVLEELARAAERCRVVTVTDDVDQVKRRFPPALSDFVLPYQKWDALVHLMKHAKIVINTEPLQVESAHERLLTAMACGAAVFSNRNVYLGNRFRHGRDIYFFEFQPGRLLKGLAEALGDPNGLENAARAGRESVLGRDLPRHRAGMLIDAVRAFETGSQAVFN